MSSRFIHLQCVTGFPSFLCLFFVCIYNILFILSSIDDHLGHFYLRALVNSDEMDMGMQRFVSDFIFLSFWCIFRSGIAGSYDCWFYF